MISKIMVKHIYYNDGNSCKKVSYNYFYKQKLNFAIL